ncbi:MAG: zinc-ribbon domain-containing protein, partial [Candidatus Peribacteraceae bacterium]|nr:zinc-ribbon domain-containing protein [Candidatus Peribacteraceae bacterium]
FGSGKKVWWTCSNEDCKHSWESSVCNRTSKRQRGCPFCAGGSRSKISQKWLDSLRVIIREHYIKDLNIRVDGFDQATNTVYEFLGNYWHGNPEIYSAEKINPHNKKSFGELYKKTLERIKLLEENGYKVVYVWENDFVNKEI